MTLFSPSLHRTLTAGTLAALLVLSTVAQAATQGTLGATSTGSITITVTKTARARISNLNDLTLASWQEGNGAVLMTDDLCVYSTRPNGGYTIRADGSGTSNAFSLANGNNVLPYSLTWNAGGVGALSNSGTMLSAGVTSQPFSKASTVSPTCSTGDTARLVIGISEQSMASAVEGSYVGTLTLLVSPN